MPGVGEHGAPSSAGTEGGWLRSVGSLGLAQGAAGGGVGDGGSWEREDTWPPGGLEDVEGPHHPGEGGGDSSRTW